MGSLSGSPSISTSTEPSSLEALLDTLDHLGQCQQRVSFGDILHALGEGAFWPMVFVAGAIIIMPLVGDIPGVPSLMAIMVLTCGVQRLSGKHEYWLPQWLARRSIDSTKLAKGVARLRKPMGWIHQWLRPRLSFMLSPVGELVVVAMTLVVCLLVFPMEFIPFSANLAAAALLLFSLAVMMRDGLLVILAIMFSVGGMGIIVMAAIKWLG